MIADEVGNTAHPPPSLPPCVEHTAHGPPSLSCRRTVMFTATWPESVRALASEFLARPVRVNVGSQELAANHRISQTVEVRHTYRKI